MKNAHKTLLEISRHISRSHPELHQHISQSIFEEHELKFSDMKLLLELGKKLILESKSQLHQDLFVLFELNFKRDGFFVEFGATNGIDLSNTYMLEKNYGWKGILAEPAKCWHREPQQNRACHIETNCVWKNSNSKLQFNEVENAEFSTINSYSEKDTHSKIRKNGKTYEVDTISLNDLLEKYHAPNDIDYLSIDTEGSEFEILSNFDFKKHSFKVITCEHNHTPMREKINKLLTENGYKRTHQELSEFDDWYVKNP